MNLTILNSNVSDYAGYYGDTVTVQCDYGHATSVSHFTESSFNAACGVHYFWDIHESVLIGAIFWNMTGSDSHITAAFNNLKSCDRK